MMTDDAVVRELADRAAILDLVAAYATALDTKDWTALGSFFVQDATWEYATGGERLYGPEAVVTRISRTLQPLEITQHLYGNHVVRVRGDEADHTCYVHAQHVRGDGEKYIGAGRYADRLQRTSDGWKFAHRELTGMWSVGNVSVVTGDEGGEPADGHGR